MRRRGSRTGVNALGNLARALKAGVRRMGESCFPGAARAWRRRRDLRRVSGFSPTPTLLDLKLRGNPEVMAAREHAADVCEMLTLIDGCDTFVDVGAYIGYYSCIAARKGKYAIALEPQPVNFQVLRQNLLENGLASRFEIHATAVSAEEGTAALFGGREGGSLVPGWAGIPVQSQYRTRVPVNTLDSIIDGRFSGERMLINIDVEGNEYEVMRGASTTLRRSPKPVWVVEAGLTDNFPGGLNPHFLDVFDLFWREGYEAAPLTDAAHVLSPDEIRLWMDRRTTKYADIHYIFRGR